MISIDEVKKLALLARLKFEESELAEFTQEIDGILNFVSQINSAPKTEVSSDFDAVNVMRDDVVTNKSSEFTEILLNEAPGREGNFVKVKKIL